MVKRIRIAAVGGAMLAMLSARAVAQEATAQASVTGAPIVLTLKRAIELALQNSKDIQVAKIQARVADHAAQITKAQFLPNLYAGSGAGYSNGIPETPGGRAPSVFSVSYTEQVFNEPLRGQAKEMQEQSSSQKIVLQDARNDVITRTAMSYLELGKVQHSLELLRKEREGELEVFLRYQLGLGDAQEIQVTPEELPGEAEQAGDNLVALALTNNTGLQLAQSDVRAKEFRLKGEKRGHLPTLELVSVYSVLAKYNNYQQFFNAFQRNNFNAGVNVQVPIFSARVKAAVGLAQGNLDAARAILGSKKSELSAEVRQKTRRVREMDAAKEVARLELQLAQQNVSVLQAQFGEGKLNLREMEKARLTENEKWMAYLDANFQKQQAQLELLKTAGQLDKVWQ